jgi:hypothetical protein
MSDKDLLDLDRRIEKVDVYFTHPKFIKNLLQDINDGLPLSEIIANASQIQQISFSNRRNKF